MIRLSTAAPPRKAYHAQKPKTKPLPLTPMQLAAKALNIEARKWEEPKSPKIDWSGYPLGELPDAEVAMLAGVSRHTVTLVRKKLGVAAYRKESK